ARRTASVPLENRLENNKEESDALEEFNTKLLTLNDKVKDFLTLAGNAVKKSASSSNDDAVHAVAGANALNSSTTLEVLSLARTATISFADHFSALDQPVFAGLAAPAAISLTVGSGAAAKTLDIEVDASTTLAQLVQKINQAGSGQVFASAINTQTGASPQYILALSGLAAGTENGSLSVNVPPEVQALGLFQNSTVSQAQDAVLNVAGIGQVRRPGNQINDLIPGVTLDLKQESTGPVTVSISSDAEKTAGKVQELVDAVNDLIRYSRENSIIKRVEDEDTVTNVYGTLARTRVDDQAIESIKTALAGAISTVTGSAVRSFADLGVTTQRDGTLSFNKDVFVGAVANNSAAAEDILQQFSDKLGTANGVIAQYT
ncbi:MAG TPA: flagellar filament capping protein FliD, partial [Oligoflexia bacterium]|nr:flagellar filament capping protein FliD [Oligoflexia bacterium]